MKVFLWFNMFRGRFVNISSASACYLRGKNVPVKVFMTNISHHIPG